MAKVSTEGFVQCSFVYVNIFRDSFPALIDAGSPCSLISRSVFDSSGLGLGSLQPTPVPLSGAGGTRICDYGTLVTEIGVSKFRLSQTFVVADVYPHVILGLDFLKRHHCELKTTPGGDVLKLHGVSLDLLAERVAMCSVIVPRSGGESESLTGGVVPSFPQHLEPMMAETAAHLTPEQNEKVRALVAEFSDVFTGPNGELGQTDLVEHNINTGDNAPVKSHPRRVPLAQREIVDAEVDKMLAAGVIEPSESPWSSSVVLVKKSGGEYRFCVDYRKLNAVTKKDAYPLPRIDSCLEALSGASWYSSLDMASGYFQVPMSQLDKEKTAFTCHRGLFQFRSMSFGLCNAGATFQRLVEKVFKGLQYENILVYVDDVLVFSKTFDDALCDLRQAFQRLRDAGLRLKPKKCSLFRRQVSFLGHVVSESGVACDPAKVEAVTAWETPTSVSDVRSFLGLASYYRKFIKDFSTVAAPLTELTKKNRRFAWDDSCQEAFDNLKSALTQHPILGFPEREGRFILDTDASATGVSGVLSQVQDGQERVIAYASKTLSSTQRRYCTTYRELLAVVTFVKHFRHFLWGRNFLVRTDHNSLKWLRNFKEPVDMVARWIAVLDTYDFEIEHRKGSLHGNADGLSRKPYRRCQRADCQQCLNCGIVGAVGARRRQQTGGQAAQLSEQSWLPVWGNEEIRRLQSEDAVVGPVLRLLENSVEKPGLDTLLGYSWGTRRLVSEWNLLRLQDGVLQRRWVDAHGSGDRWLVVLPRKLRREVLRQLHDSKTAGHLGRDKTTEAVRGRFYWPGLKGDVAGWCKKCLVCARRKPGSGRERAQLQQGHVGAPFQRMRYYDRKEKFRQYEEGDLVFRWYPPTANLKLGLGWSGPYVVRKRVSDVLYEISLPVEGSRPVVVHVDHLKPCEGGNHEEIPDDGNDDEGDMGHEVRGVPRQPSRESTPSVGYPGANHEASLVAETRGVEHDVEGIPSPIRNRRGRVIRKPKRYLD